MSKIITMQCPKAKRIKAFRRELYKLLEQFKDIDHMTIIRAFGPYIGYKLKKLDDDTKIGLSHYAFHLIMKFADLPNSIDGTLIEEKDQSEEIENEIPTV